MGLTFIFHQVNRAIEVARHASSVRQDQIAVHNTEGKALARRRKEAADNINQAETDMKETNRRIDAMKKMKEDHAQPSENATHDKLSLTGSLSTPSLGDVSVSSAELAQFIDSLDDTANTNGISALDVHIAGGENILASQEALANQFKADMKDIDEESLSHGRSELKPIGEPKQLESVLGQLLQVDQILTRLTMYWSGFEVAFDVVNREGDKAESLVNYMGNQRFLDMLQARIKQFSGFWAAFRDICTAYIRKSPKVNYQFLEAVPTHASQYVDDGLHDLSPLRSEK